MGGLLVYYTELQSFHVFCHFALKRIGTVNNLGAPDGGGGNGEAWFIVANAA